MSIDTDFHQQFNRCQFNVNFFFLSFDEQSENKNSFDLVVITEILQLALCVIFHYFTFCFLES